VKGKKPHSQGSCKPKVDTELTTSEKNLRAQRRMQLVHWQEEYPHHRNSAVQHLSAPGKAKKKVSTKRGAPKTAKKRSTPRWTSRAKN
jgi:hypothetical protein